MRAVAVGVVLAALAVACAAGPVKCPSGKRPTQSAAPLVSNGCGAAGMAIKIDTGDADVTPCCDVHDACYSLCGVARQRCESEFDKCLKAKCKTARQKQQCESGVQMMTAGASMMGGSFFEQAQQAGCACVAADDAKAAYGPHATDVYERAGVGDAAARVEKFLGLLEKPSYGGGKEGYLLLDLLKKYPHGIRRETGGASSSGEL